MKQYKHKKTWRTTREHPSCDDLLIKKEWVFWEYTIPKELIEDSQDREEIGQEEPLL